jgi:hypothetical protein
VCGGYVFCGGVGGFGGGAPGGGAGVGAERRTDLVHAALAHVVGMVSEGDLPAAAAAHTRRLQSLSTGKKQSSDTGGSTHGQLQVAWPKRSLR